MDVVGGALVGRVVGVGGDEVQPRPGGVGGGGGRVHELDAPGMRSPPRPGPSRHDKTASLLGAVEYAPVFGPFMRLQEFDERSPVVGQQQERLREPGGRCLKAGNGYTRSVRPYAGPSWTSEPARWTVQVDTRGFFPTKFYPE